MKRRRYDPEVTLEKPKPGNPSVRVLANFGILLMALGTVAMTYIAPRYYEESLLSGRSARLVLAKVEGLDRQERVVAYSIKTRAGKVERSGRLYTTELDLVEQKGTVPVRVSVERPWVSQIARSELPDQELRRVHFHLALAGLLVGFLTSYFSTSWEHLTPVFAAWRAREKAPKGQVKRALHNLAGALAIMVGVSGAAGLQMASGYCPFFMERQWQFVAALLAGFLGMTALQRWTPFKGPP